VSTRCTCLEGNEPLLTRASLVTARRHDPALESWAMPESVLENPTKMMPIDKALERLNNKLSLIAVAAGIAAAVDPTKVLPFMYANRVYVFIYLIVGVAPIQELCHPVKTLEQMKTDPRLGFVWFAKFIALWCVVLAGFLLLLCHRETASDRTAAVPDHQKLACENGATDPECKNQTSVIEIHGGETLKYIPPPSNLPRLDAGFVPILYLGHNQKFFLSCGVLGEQGTPAIVKDSTATCQ